MVSDTHLINEYHQLSELSLRPLINRVARIFINMSKTVVVGASLNPTRYSHVAIHRLVAAGMEVAAVGLRAGTVCGVEIKTDQPPIENVDTVTLYVGPRHQSAWMDYVHALAPRRVIFNPGTENPEWIRQLDELGIEAVIACTLVMLSVGNY